MNKGDIVHVVRCADCIHNIEGEREMMEYDFVKPYEFCWWGQTADGRVSQEVDGDSMKYRFNKTKASSLYGEMKENAKR